MTRPGSSPLEIVCAPRWTWKALNLLFRKIVIVSLVDIYAVNFYPRTQWAAVKTTNLWTRDPPQKRLFWMMIPTWYGNWPRVASSPLVMRFAVPKSIILNMFLVKLLSKNTFCTNQRRFCSSDRLQPWNLRHLLTFELKY
jgi:hypothetical protein